MTTVTPSILPEWLMPYQHQELDPVELVPDKRYPRTKDQRIVRDHIYECLFYQALDVVAEGRSVKAFIERDPRDVTMGEFMRWMRKDPERARLYQEAEEIGAEVATAELTAIADGDPSMCPGDIPQDVAQLKLRIDTRKWIIERHNAKKYGAKVSIESTTTNTFVIRNLIEKRQQEFEQMTYEHQEHQQPDSGDIVDGEIVE